MSIYSTKSLKFIQYYRWNGRELTANEIITALERKLTKEGTTSLVV